jgi:hypothetical protein
MATGGTPTTSSFGIAGTPTTLEMLLPVECGNRMPTGVTVSVLGPSDENVPVDAGTPQSGTAGFTTDVTFTPTTPGGYHIAARFEPNLGLAQYDLVAAADRRDAGFAVLTTDSSNVDGCDHVEVSPSGRLVCIDNTAGSKVYDRDQVTISNFDGIAEYADGVLWQSNNGSLTRFVDSDAGFVAHESGSIGSGGVVRLLPTASDVVVIQGNGATFITPAPDGGLTSVRLDTTFATPDWRDSNFAANLVAAPASLHLSPLDGGTQTNQMLGGFNGISLFGMDTGGIWASQSLSSGGPGNFVYQIGSDGSQSLKLPDSWGAGNSQPKWEHAPILSSSGATDLVLNGSMNIEAYLNDTTESLGQVCTRFAVVKSGSKARIVPRP